MSLNSFDTDPRKFLIVEDHPMYLEITCKTLHQQYPEAEIFTAQTVKSIFEQIKTQQFDLVIFDLAVPQTLGEEAIPGSGVATLKDLMEQYPDLNLVAQSAYIKCLRRIKPQIDNHQGGFTMIDKSSTSQDFLKRVNWALDGIADTRKLKLTGRGVELKPEWQDVLRFAFQEGLQDQAIADKMHVALRTVIHYWKNIRDALEVYPESGQNIRIQTEIRAREEGLID